MTTTAPLASAQPATPREWIGLAVLALPTLLVSIDVSLMILALPLGAVVLVAWIGTESVRFVRKRIAR